VEGLGWTRARKVDRQWRVVVVVVVVEVVVGWLVPSTTESTAR
jgi:hypothetical protein